MELYRFARLLLITTVIIIAALVAGAPSAIAQGQEDLPGIDKFSKGVMVKLRPGTRVPTEVNGLNVRPAALKEEKAKLSRENVDTVLKGFLKEHKVFFQVDADELRIKVVNERKGKWYVKYQQYHNGLEVIGSTVGMRAAEDGQVTSYSSTFRENLHLPKAARISLKQAVEIALKEYPAKLSPTLEETEGALVYFPMKDRAGEELRLAWRFLITGERVSKEHKKYFIVDAERGKILKSYTADFPNADATGRVRGEIYPERPTDTATIMPLDRAYVNASGKKTTTDSDGKFKISLPWWNFFTGWKYTGMSVLEGPFAQALDNAGNGYTMNRNCKAGTSCEFLWTNADRDHITVFYHINLLHDWYKTNLNHSWTNAWDGTSTFRAEVNHAGNNAYAGSPMEFGNDPFARHSEIIYHECTHNVLYSLFGGYVGWPASNSEGYAFDEGFADYFGAVVTNDSLVCEPCTSMRNLNNNTLYAGKRTYNTEGHSGGTIIAGAAWDIRASFINKMGQDAGSLAAANLVFDALNEMSALTSSYYFSDPQESNFLTSLYRADDDNNNLLDGVPHFFDIQESFYKHSLLRATLINTNSYDVSTNTLGTLTNGDFYYSQGKIWANNYGQRGVKDLGDVGNVDFHNVVLDTTGYTRFGVDATVGHTYVSLAQTGEEGNYIVFKVNFISADKSEMDIEYLYRRQSLVIVDFCKKHPDICGKLACKFNCKLPDFLTWDEGIRVRFEDLISPVVVEVNKICQYVIDCPGCGTGSLCTGYDLELGDVVRDMKVEIFDSAGNLVVADPGGRGNKKLHLRTMANRTYFLIITPGANTKLGTEYKIPLTVSPVR